MKISFIIPVYNVEKYLDRCINSIISQDKNNIEIILTDDGSTDNSPMICDKFANQYDFIKVIHKENEGVSLARNDGLNIATGEYIMFLDSDDMLADNAIKNMRNIIEENIDLPLFTFEFEEIDENDNKINFYLNKINPGIYDKENFIKTYYSAGSRLPWCACQNIYNAKFIKQFNSVFSKDYVAAEDALFYITYIKNISNLYYSDLPIFYYRINRKR